MRLLLVTGLLSVAVSIALVLTGSPAALIATDGVWPNERVTVLHRGTRFCQPGERPGRETSAIRLSLASPIGPPIEVEAIAQGRILARGSQLPGWAGEQVTVPVAPRLRTSAPVRICVRVGLPGARGGTPLNEKVSVLGQSTSGHDSASTAAGPLHWKVRIEYLRAGSASWWSRVLPTARRMGLAGAAGGAWIAVVAVALMGAATAIGSWLALRELP